MTPISPPASKADMPRDRMVYHAGFIDLATTTFQEDTSARSDGMPFTRFYANDIWTPVTYDNVLHRWLPVRSSSVSPDHNAYAYVVFSPLSQGMVHYTSSSLHIYNIRTGQDRTLLTHEGAIWAKWAPDGVYAVAELEGKAETTSTGVVRPAAVGWLIDPNTGSASELSAVALDGLRSAGHELPPGGMFLGVDSAGNNVIRAGWRDPGTAYRVYVQMPNGQQTLIFSGQQEDATGFDPYVALARGDELYFTDYDAKEIWRWTRDNGLSRLAISGLPGTNIDKRHGTFSMIWGGSGCAG